MNFETIISSIIDDTLAQIAFSPLLSLFLDSISTSVNSLLLQSDLFVFFFTLKFLLCISLLVFVRGGMPRYRYDFLTKIGWLKLLSLLVIYLLLVQFSIYLLC